MLLISAPAVGLPAGAPHLHSSLVAAARAVESQLTAAVVLGRLSIMLAATTNVTGSADNCPRNWCCGSSKAALDMKILNHARSIVVLIGTGTVVHRMPQCSVVESILTEAASSVTSSRPLCDASSELAPTCSSIVTSISMG